MAQTLHYRASGHDIEMEQILFEAQHRWLRPPEICEILRNYKRFNIAPEPPNMPPSGSLFLFDRKVLRYFRKDGHNWRKKKDGKTVKEAHERLKAGSVDMLHCYYAHGEENHNFQRRSYWMLEEELSHIVLVHYREVKGYKTNFNRVKVAEEAIPNPPAIEAETSVNSSVQRSRCHMLSQNTDSESLNDAQASDYEDAESDIERHLGSSCKVKDTNVGKLNDYHGIDSVCQGGQTMCSVDHTPQTPLSHAVCKEVKSDNESNLTIENRSSHFSAVKCPLDGSSKDKGLKKNDSFGRWMSKELRDMESVVPSSSGAYWDDAMDSASDNPSLPSEAELVPYTVGPSLSQDQHFRIIDFSPTWGYAGSETKVLITGKILKNQHAGKCQWSCMFGEVEVPAELIADGVLRCHTPLHGVGRVPFYVTCSNRLACSEVREFEYRDKFTHDLDAANLGNHSEALQIRFGRLLSLGSGGCHRSVLSGSFGDNCHLQSEIGLLLKGNEDEWSQILMLTSKEEISLVEVKERLAEKLLKEKLCEWLLAKEAEGGIGVLDENGQGVLHFAAALGYDWAISPTIAAGVNINFRDVRGWTALHWAASYGRERTVGYLISLGASAGALTDPTPTHPTGRTAADLASENGHKGIAGYLAESSLSAHLVSLKLRNKTKEGNDTKPSGMTPVLTASERTATPIGNGDPLDGLSLKDSLAAVCNATQAAARIHQVYRVQSFQRKQRRDLSEDNKFRMSNEQALSVVTVKSQKQGHHDEPVHAAAVRIQNKFRSWKGRKDFLTIRQQVVKIQAHVRGHQARKFVWSVGIVEKAILRWRRKRSGLRVFNTEEPNSEGTTSSKEDDYDFLKEGRKQAEERLQKALLRVKSMVQYPEARDQYRRLLTTVADLKEMKGEGSGANVLEAAASMNDDLIDVDTLVNDDTFMSTDC